VGRTRLRLGVTLVAALGLVVAGTLTGGGDGAAALLAAMLVGSVLVHEGAHALAARALGYRVEWIVLGIVDGRISYSGPADRPLDRAAIAMAGPAVSAAVALGLLGAWAGGVGGPGDVVFHAVVFNVLTFAVNLVPIAGSDGQMVVAGLIEDRRRRG
jgi:Zn-dependent protease